MTKSTIPNHSLTRLRALIYKESLQVLRDPATLLIAFALPIVLMLLFAYAVSLDVKNVRFAVVLEGQGAQARSLAAAYAGTPFLDTSIVRHRNDIRHALTTGQYRGFVVIPADFEKRLHQSQAKPVLQIIVDGTQPQTANFTLGYATGVFNNWLASQGYSAKPAARMAPRYWFNAELDSRRVLLPGAIAIVMTMIGTLLTALVVAREWERGTMEAMLATPARMGEILVGKLLPYLILALLANLSCSMLAIYGFDVPFRGSVWALLGTSLIFMVPALGQGLLISTLAKNQFVASQMALLSGFLPAFLLSGFLFEIDSMPLWIQWLTTLVPARYYVSALQTIFLAGDIWNSLWHNLIMMALLGLLFFAITLLKSKRGLE